MARPTRPRPYPDPRALKLACRPRSCLRTPPRAAVNLNAQLNGTKAEAHASSRRGACRGRGARHRRRRRHHRHPCPHRRRPRDRGRRLRRSQTSPRSAHGSYGAVRAERGDRVDRALDEVADVLRSAAKAP